MNGLESLKQYIAPVEYHFTDMSEHKIMAVYFIVDRVNERIIKAITINEYKPIAEAYKGIDMAIFKTDKLIEEIKQYIRDNIFKPNL